MFNVFSIWKKNIEGCYNLCTSHRRKNTWALLQECSRVILSTDTWRAIQWEVIKSTHEHIRGQPEQTDLKVLVCHFQCSCVTLKPAHVSVLMSHHCSCVRAQVSLLKRQYSHVSAHVSISNQNYYCSHVIAHVSLLQHECSSVCAHAFVLKILKFKIDY